MKLVVYLFDVAKCKSKKVRLTKKNSVTTCGFLNKYDYQVGEINGVSVIGDEIAVHATPKPIVAEK